MLSMAKLFTLLMSLSFFTLIAFSQTYTPFPTKNIIWKQDYTEKYAFTNTNICETRTLEIEKDTIIHSITYHKILRTVDHYDGDFNRGCMVNATRFYGKNTFGYFRNDSINKKVWLRLPNASQDSLWFDFNYSVGDTLRPTYAITAYNANFNHLIITRIDSILIGNSYRRSYVLNDSSCLSALNPLFGLPYPSQLIEGIGSTNGIDKHAYGCGGLRASSRYLSCVQVNGQTVYPDTNSCTLVTGLNSRQEKKTDLSFSPNPSSGQIFIDNPQKIKSRLNVYHSNGKRVKSFLSIPQSFELNLPSGLYFITLEIEGGEKLVHKAVIRNN